MTDIAIETTTYQVEDLSWLSSHFGYDEPRSITLDVSAFTLATHAPNGYFPSGLVLAKITATGLFGPYSDAAGDGRAVAVGHLAFSRKVPNPSNTAIDCSAAMLEMGLIVEAKLPSGHGLDAAAKTDLVGWFKYL